MEIEGCAKANKRGGTSSHLSSDSETKDIGDRWQRLVHRWFVLYNPLYIVSALLTVTGVYVLGDTMHHGGVPWVQGRLALAATTQIYELALVAAAALLVRHELRRPAVILGLVAAVFAVDACLHTEALAHTEPWDGLAAAAWVIFAWLKWGLWCRVLRLRFSPLALAWVGGGLAMSGLVPWLLDGGLSATVDSTSVLTTVLWILAAGVVAARWRRPRITTTWALDGFGQQVLRRAETTVLALVAGSIGLRFGLWAINARFEFVVELFFPLAWVLLAWAPSERWAWSVSAAWVAMQMQTDGVVPSVAVLALLTVVWCTRRLERPDLATLAVLWGAAAAWGMAPEPLWIGAPTVVVLAAMAWRHRLPSAALAAAAGAIVGAFRIDLTAAQWGMALLLGGFLTLALGVLASLRLTRPSGPGSVQSADAFGPSDGVTP